MSSDDDDDGRLRPHYRTNYGDIGIVVIAAGCTLAFLMMLLLPSPIAKWQKEKAAQDAKARQEAIQKAVSSGEVSVGIAPEKH
jgi:hypothetical protein